MNFKFRDCLVYNSPLRKISQKEMQWGINIETKFHFVNNLLCINTKTECERKSIF